MNKLRNILELVADKIHSWWTLGVIGIAIACIVVLAFVESIGLIKNKDDNKEDPGY